MVEKAVAVDMTGRNRFAFFLAIAVVGLITAGALVTSKQAGLSVPDWPLSYGTLNPPGWWQIENVRAEHGHRLFAGLVALSTLGLAIWTGRRERRRWVRQLSYSALGVVLIQAVLGGMTVLLFLPTPVSVGHAGLAQLFLGLIVTAVVVTSRWWEDPPVVVGDGWPGVARLVRLRNLAALLAGAVYCQILVGAVMRHSGAGLAIPDFPLAFGRLVPRAWSFAISIHYAHRVGAVVVSLLVLAVVFSVVRSARVHVRLVRLALLMLFLLCLQITLGAAVVLTGKAVSPNTLHVGTGASIWALSVGFALMTGRLVNAGRSPRATAEQPAS